MKRMARIRLLFVYGWEIIIFLTKDFFLFYLTSPPHPISLPLVLNGYSSQHTESPGSIQGVAVTSPAGVEVTNEKQGKKKSKIEVNAVLQPNPLDQTCIHPESYDIAMRWVWGPCENSPCQSKFSTEMAFVLA